MKGLFVRSLMPMVMVTVMFAATNVYSQTTGTGDVKSHTISKELVTAKWKIGDIEYTFEKNGTSLVAIDKRECPGTWELRGKTLIINPKKLMYKKDDPCSKTKVLQIISVSGNELHVFDKSKKKEFHLVKQSTKETE